MACKIHKTKTQDHLGNHLVTRKVTVKPFNSTVDHRTDGVPLSAVEPQNNTIRENKVKRLVENLKNHKNKDLHTRDSRHTEKINQFSKESKDLNNIEIFGLRENYSKQQCPDSTACWEMGIIYCSCGEEI